MVASATVVFFVNYGFSLDENEDNEAIMYLGLKSTDPYYATKINIMGRQNPIREYQVPANYTETKTKEMFSFLRFCNARDYQLLGISNQGRLDDIAPISWSNEIMCLNDLRDAATVALSNFDTTFEEDTKLLKEGNITDSNIRNCVVVRRGEKEVLHWYISLADKVIPLLQMSWRRLQAVAASCVQNTCPLDEYVLQVVMPLVRNSR